MSERFDDRASRANGASMLFAERTSTTRSRLGTPIAYTMAPAHELTRRR